MSHKLPSVECEENALRELATLVSTLRLQEYLSENTIKVLDSYMQPNQTMEREISLDLRLSLPEYMHHIQSAMKLPGGNMEFLATIVRIVYLMMMVEKDPTLAFQLKNAAMVTHALSRLEEVR